jgi:hypothetical protein
MLNASGGFFSFYTGARHLILMADEPNNQPNSAELFNVRPLLAEDDSFDLLARQPVSLADLTVLPRNSQRANLTDLIVRHFRPSVIAPDRTEADPICVQNVFFLRAIFKVACSVVGFVSAFVVDFLPVRSWANECVSDQNVNGEGRHLSILTQTDTQISPVTKVWFAGMRFQFSPARADSILRPNVSQIRNAVYAFVAGHRAPIFHLFHSHNFTINPCILQGN